MSTKRNASADRPGFLRVVYRTRCGNLGCGHSWDITVTAKDLSPLSARLGCPRCSRRGGRLRAERRLRSNSRTTYYQATLMFPAVEGSDFEFVETAAGDPLSA
jgi:hypothetical protein